MEYNAWFFVCLMNIKKRKDNEQQKKDTINISEKRDPLHRKKIRDMWQLWCKVGNWFNIVSQLAKFRKYVPYTCHHAPINRINVFGLKKFQYT